MESVEHASIQRLLQLPLEELLARAWQVRVEHFRPSLDLAVPGARHYRTEHYVNTPHRFATISLTGTACALNCAHCERHLLESMYAALTSAALCDLGRSLRDQGCEGVLLSGGADRHGAVPLRGHLPAIAQLKEMGLQVIVHTGMPDREIARELHAAGVDQVLFDVVGDEDTIRTVLGLPYKPEDYARALVGLREGGLSVAPHVVIGLHFGQLRGELHAIEIVRNVGADVLVLVVLRPLPGTAMADAPLPRAEEVGRLVAVARLLLPETPLTLGCIRPVGRARVEMERLAVLAGINAVAYPDPETVRLAAERGLQVEFLESCCTLVGTRRIH
ncbi:MAG: radical SAM protein [Anaerolineae bacterium]|nr:radical SAM protein [Anaerolineae bacterium]